MYLFQKIIPPLSQKEIPWICIIAYYDWNDVCGVTVGSQIPIARSAHQ